MQLGFVIDHSQCIGCHACTVACKSENAVPLGKFRTWVKYTEQGTFPRVRRSFAVLRCNQCTDAPCVTICPVGALAKRADGIVDVDPAICIGCKACLQGCPYDAIYLNDDTGTVEKCHFCAHRTEVGLAPACAVVCPTEAIVPGDFHDPSSKVSRLRAEHRLTARKPEAGTSPNVLYRDVAEAGIDPTRTHAAGGYLWSNPMPGLNLDAERTAAALAEAEGRAAPRTTYDVDHAPAWGGKVSAYLFTKSLAAGLALAFALLTAVGPTPGGKAATLLLGGAILFLAATSVLLVADLKRPERFYTILTRPNLASWLTRGAFVLAGYGGVLALTALVIGVGSPGGLRNVMVALTAVLALLSAAYTGWLFAQAKGRVLWLRRGLALHLAVQAGIAGAGAALALLPALDPDPLGASWLRWLLFGSLAAHAHFVLTEDLAAPRDREREYGRALRLLHPGGPLFPRQRAANVLFGAGAVLLLVPDPRTWIPAGVLALVALYLEEDLTVRAGQAPSIS